MEDTKLTYSALLEHYHFTLGLWCIDRNPNEVDIDWIRENAFQPSPINGKQGVEQNNTKMEEGDFVYIKWVDSYGVLSGWVDLSEYNPNLLMIESVGRVVKVNDEIVAIAHNYSDVTENTPQQANGIMVIPRIAIKEVISFSSYLRLELVQKQQRS